MAANFRQSDILEIAQTQGRVSVDDLSERLGISVQTIRKDLAQLAEAGKLERVHGGAILPSGVTNIDYAERQELNRAAKAAIATRCAADIPDNASVFLNIGTSTEAVARELLNHRNLMVVTNNMNIAQILATNPTLEVIVAGGTLRRSDGGLTGPQTVLMIQTFKFDYAVIGCSALDQDGDILDFDLAEVGVSQTVIAQSRERFLVADITKFTRTAPVRIASLKDLTRFYTDAPPSPQIQRKCDSWKTQIIQS
ncbi:MAG: DeoR/GlpR family DNA-binding transcription regulator [Litoreibacter sp.]|nr:DeoR/GlpR family DNA-binding transcription regulator [Litoreibacter sp.]MCY4336986.1 DeoR/GlpR family DNA-binding transcription regulator [Litoreibacter sp.]